MTSRARSPRRQRNLILRGSILAAIGALSGYGCGTTVTTFEGAGGTESTSPSSTSSGSNGACKNPQPIMEADGTPSGYERCEDGAINRYDATESCDTTVSLPACQGTEMDLRCQTDGDCTARPHGKCSSFAESNFGDEYTGCGCIYPCETDADCDTGLACLCGDVLPADAYGYAHCVPASCDDGSTCPGSNECGASIYDDGCGQTAGLGCRADSDACRTDAPCEEYQTCALEYGTGPWTCASGDCAIGRPLLLADGPRTAPSARRADWADHVDPHLPADDATRTHLAQHWEHVGALEHASVASFNRFSLQLMALGAPPELLGQAQAAAADEIEHARLAYALASAYRGHDVGPGPLELRDMTIHTDRRTAILELVAEACVGETVGVAEARELAAWVEDPVLHEIHTRIADDEQRHAQLAWRALAWMLEGADDALKAEVKATFEAAAYALGSPGDPPCIAPEHGLPSGAQLASVRRQALHDVVLPCAGALFA